MVPVPPCPPSSLGLRFSLVNDSEGWLCIKEVSGEVHTARPLQGAQPGDMYTVLVEAQYEGMARQGWGFWRQSKPQAEGEVGRAELSSQGPFWHPLPQAGKRNEGWGQCPSLKCLASASPLRPPSSLDT